MISTPEVDLDLYKPLIISRKKEKLTKEKLTIDRIPPNSYIIFVFFDLFEISSKKPKFITYEERRERGCPVTTIDALNVIRNLLQPSA
jgi:hypothetical protein